MTHWRKLGRLLAGVLVAVVLSCTPAKPRPAVPAPAVEPTQVTAHKGPQPTARAVDLARRHMTSGDYQKAIDAYRAEYERVPGDKRLLDTYVESIETMASLADTALDRRDLGAAGKTYAILLNNYRDFKTLGRQLSFTEAGLRRKLDYCKKNLYQQGFQEYRSGNLGRAIAQWQDLLVIDPGNTDIQEALKTARLQQKTLRETD